MMPSIQGICTQRTKTSVHRLCVPLDSICPEEYISSIRAILDSGIITIFLAPPAERQRSFSNTDLSVCQDFGGGGGVEGSISETLQ